MFNEFLLDSVGVNMGTGSPTFWNERYRITFQTTKNSEKLSCRRETARRSYYYYYYYHRQRSWEILIIAVCLSVCLSVHKISKTLLAELLTKLYGRVDLGPKM